MRDQRGLFTQKLLQLQKTLGEYKELMMYLLKYYLKYDKFIHWSAAYQPQVFTSMETNNYIESWHNQLKTNYLQRKENRRLDCLIFILVDDAHTGYMYNTTRMVVNIESMSSETRETKKRMTEAEEINGLSLEDMVQEVYIDEEVCYIAKSFTTEVVYDISTEQRMMTACYCIDFQRNKRACKHMYLVYCFDIVFSSTSLMSIVMFSE